MSIDKAAAPLGIALWLPLLFADAGPDPNSTWTLKELAAAVATSILVAGSAVWAITRNLDDKNEKKKDQEILFLQSQLQLKQQELLQKQHEISSKQNEIDKFKQGKPSQDDATQGGELQKVEGQLDELRQHLAAWLAANAEDKDRLATAEQKLASSRELLGHLNGDLQQMQRTLTDYDDELAGLRNRLKRATKKDGMIWTEKVKYDAPKFRSLAESGRRTPILSILNLKGGVGKTTVSANLGAAFASLGYRVLLIDLDLQGSLTGLFLPVEIQKQLQEGGSLLEDFLANSFDAEYPNLNNYSQRTQRDRVNIVPTADTLAYAELNLTIRWLLREGNKDPRFLLRRELHLKRITDAYDIILLDCPPLLNVGCINALAASDYLLVPVMPSPQATSRVPVLLRRLREFRDSVTPELRILGMVANRTHGSALTHAEENTLSYLDQAARMAWGDAVPCLEPIIPQSREVREAEEESRPLSEGATLFEAFRHLAEEIEKRLPEYCRQARPVPSLFEGQP